jgi:hypothetical protein
VPDRDPVGHAARQLEGLEEVAALTSEHREAVGAIAREIVLQEGARAFERRLERRLVLVREPVPFAEAAFGLVDERAHGGLPSRRRGELRGVQVQIQAEDDWTVESELGETAELVTIRSAYLHATGPTHRLLGVPLRRKAPPSSSPLVGRIGKLGLLRPGYPQKPRLARQVDTHPP